MSDMDNSVSSPSSEEAPENRADEQNAASETTPHSDTQEESSKESRRRILIGSQRDPAAYRPKPQRDWTPVVKSARRKPGGQKPADEAADLSQGPPAVAQQTTPSPPTSEVTPTASVQEAALDDLPAAVPSADTSPSPQQEAPAVEKPAPQEPRPAVPPTEELLAETTHPEEQLLEEPLPEALIEGPVDLAPGGRVPLPNLRAGLSPDLEAEFDRAIGGAPVEELMEGAEALTREQLLEPETRLTGQVVAIQRDDVFIDLGGREQGCISAKLFETPPQPGASLEVVVQRFNPEDGLYELTLPNAAVSVDHWADLSEGMLVDARVTGHNEGGLEVEVNHLRGFIPISQVAIYRIENLAEFVDQKLTCLVTEVNPQRRNLVLSRRAVLEREKEEARQQLLASLEPGQVREGVVRKLVDFGAFVDLGGVDGLLHISQLSWGRVEHPREVLAEGQKVRVKVEQVNRETGKISLAYRELLENPWTNAAVKYPVNGIVEGTVSKLMEFGAFVELEPGVEGLIHISELSYKRVWRPGDVVQEGQRVRVMVLSVDPEAQRMSLSMKQLEAKPEPKKEEDLEPGPPLDKKSRKRPGPDKPLQGGLGKVSGGEQFGLNW